MNREVRTKGEHKNIRKALIRIVGHKEKKTGQMIHNLQEKVKGTVKPTRPAHQGRALEDERRSHEKNKADRDSAPIAKRRTVDSDHVKGS